MGGKLPLSYYNIINEDVTRNDVPKEKDYGQIPGVNQDVPNPNAINRPLAWPIRVKSSICSDIQVRQVSFCWFRKELKDSQLGA